MSFDQHIIRLVLELRRMGITSTQVLSALERVPRHEFVASSFVDQAWENIALPIGCNQTISQPYIVARMTEALGVHDRDKVLEVGTGSGYQSLILAKLCRRLYTMERHKPLLAEARARFESLKQSNIVSKIGDGTLGWPEQAPFGRIMVTAAAADVPGALADQLAVGGTMIIPVGEDAASQWLYKVTRSEDGFETQELDAVRFVPLMTGVAGETLDLF